MVAISKFVGGVLLICAAVAAIASSLANINGEPGIAWILAIASMLLLIVSALVGMARAASTTITTQELL